MLVVMSASVVLVSVTILVLYETLRLTSEHLAETGVRGGPACRPAPRPGNRA